MNTDSKTYDLIQDFVNKHNKLTNANIAEGYENYKLSLIMIYGPEVINCLFQLDDLDLQHNWKESWGNYNRSDFECQNCKMYKIIEKENVIYYTKRLDGRIIPDRLHCNEFTIKKLLE